MLIYSNKSFFRLVFQCSGSVCWSVRGLLGGLITAGLTAFLQRLADTGEKWVYVENQFGMQALGVIVTFAVVFRTNLGWQRYWEAVSQLHFMYSKLQDSFAQFDAFATVSMEHLMKKSDGEDANYRLAKRVQTMRDTVESNFVLLSGMAADRLGKGDCARMEQRNKMHVIWNKRIIDRGELYQEDLTGATALPEFTSKSAMLLDNSNWRSTCLVMTAPKGTKLKLLAESKDRVNLVMYWILHNFGTICADLKAPPPIQSRMYQELSNGMLGYNNVLKIADVPFPFAHAQLLSMLLLVWALFIPFYIMNFTQSYILGPAISFVLFESMWCLNELAKELENPFGQDVNDIGLQDFHTRFFAAVSELARAGRTAYQLEEREMLEDEEHANDEARKFGLLQEKNQSNANIPPPQPATPPVVKAQPTAPPVAEADPTQKNIEERLVQIGRRIEEHVATIAAELKGISRLDSIIDSIWEIGQVDEASAEQSTGYSNSQSSSSAPIPRQRNVLSPGPCKIATWQLRCVRNHTYSYM